MGSTDLPRESAFADAIEGLMREADMVSEQLADEDAGTDLEELAGSLQKVHADAHAAAMEAPGHPDLVVAVRHLREACDLLDDGMPADAVIFEVLAAGISLKASLKSGEP